jgi:ribonuclease T
MSRKREVFISVDVETSGPVPGEFSMLTLGACLAEDQSKTFSMSLRPINDAFVPEALAVTGLSLERLAVEGLAPEKEMTQFGHWVASHCHADTQAVFVGMNAPFDWAFVNYYFHRSAGANPFGFTALDIKALYMGATGSTWHDTKSSSIAKVVKPTLKGDHDALHDALYQAELFRLVLALSRKSSLPAQH